MNLKGVFADRTALFQIFLLLALILTGAMLAGLASALFPAVLDIKNPDSLRLFQFISSVFSFLLPALLVAYLCSSQPKEYLSVKGVYNMKAILLVFMSMFFFSPTITLTGILNKLVKLPSFMAPIESWMQSMETTAEQMTQLLLSNTDWYSVCLNLLVIAITAAVTEEFFFRGVLQRIIGKWTNNHHLLIWAVAFLFSAVHMQFYGFIPRMLLGAYFGYLLYWSKSIWLPVFAHFINNAVAVLGMSNESLKDNAFVSGEVAEGEIIYFAIPAVITFVLFLFCIKHIKRELGVEENPSQPVI